MFKSRQITYLFERFEGKGENRKTVLVVRFKLPGSDSIIAYDGSDIDDVIQFMRAVRKDAIDSD